MIKLWNYLNKIAATSHYSITFSSDKFNYLNKWLVKGVYVENKSNMSTQPYIDESGDIALHHELAYISKEEREKNWRYYYYEVRDQAENQYTDYSKNTPQTLFEPEQNKYIYSLCCIYSQKNQHVLFSVNSSNSIRVWINGKLVCLSGAGAFIFPYIFKFKLKKGINTVLVEKAFFTARQSSEVEKDYFSIHFKPYECFNNDKCRTFIDSEYFGILENTFSIIPEKYFYGRDDKINAVVLLKSLAGSKEDKILITVYNALDEELYTCFCNTSKCICLNKACKKEGILRLSVQSLHNKDKKSHTYIFYGDFTGYMDNLIRKLCEMPGVEDEAVQRLKSLKKLYDRDRGLCLSSAQVLTEKTVYAVLHQLARFEAGLSQRVKGSGAGRFKHCKPFYESEYITGLYGEESDSDKYNIYTVSFPQSKKTENKNRLFVFYQPEPVLPYYFGRDCCSAHNEFLRNTVLMSVCDSAGEGGKLKYRAAHDVIENIIKKFNIDRDRIYLVSSHDGVYRALGLASSSFAGGRAFTFAAIAVTGLMAGYEPGEEDWPIPEYMSSIGHTTVLQLNNMEHPFLNLSQALYAARFLSRVKVWNFDNFEANEFKVMFNSLKLLGLLAEHNKEKFPGGANSSGTTWVY
ncbi:hypothetical protein DFR58_12163 [Anaerobacterium chartisolvens]|uniref:Uncharacterized protein n=1 Tax=Anaerobacterium chartisolvens TaxID=1297424 RepID=A0A369AT89_9FIRM|nr:hypothetical protein [Anaerobacterium chartisolvens]RCX12559.1 hypothetical protein DFR58_12163 [Anaerobacterium chartisolvens]